MKKRQPKEGEWIKVSNTLTGEVIVGMFISAGLEGVTLKLENGDSKTFRFLPYYDIGYLYRNWDWKLDDSEQVIWKLSSPDKFVKFEIINDEEAENVELYMYIGPNKMLLEEYSSIYSCKEHVEKIISAIKNIE